MNYRFMPVARYGYVKKAPSDDSLMNQFMTAVAFTAAILSIIFIGGFIYA